MAAKLCAVIMAMGVVAIVVLSLRQARLEAVHELAEAQKRFHQHDRDLYRLRAQIADAIRPDRVHTMAMALGTLHPIGIDPITPEGPALAENEPATDRAIRTVSIPSAPPAPSRPARTTPTPSRPSHGSRP